MAIVVPNQAERNILKLILNTDFGEGSTPTPSENLFIHIFKSDVTVDENTLLADLTTAELSVDEYPEVDTEREVANTEWTLATSNGVATATEKSLVLRNLNDPFFIYGYFITKGVDADSGVLMWAEKFPSPFQIPTGGSTVKLTLRLELD